ncbi:hypothetical protein COCNU_07G013950 [Cocos nucifera]|uniref:Uncharacterized protein n=1 Tax=Cocos nucifera TaxID=13894 RepID=A0A8K0IGD1_COCNU|nr:hypothetical protein COCNU_07G013950 [Cocos nucifera]
MDAAAVATMMSLTADKTDGRSLVSEPPTICSGSIVNSQVIKHGTEIEKQILDISTTVSSILSKLKAVQRWLDGLEKNKHTRMDRKTLTRTLNKLQQEGLCKCVQIVGSPKEIDNMATGRLSCVINILLRLKDAVDAYWETLEYFYTAADPAVASHAFPGSSVREIKQFSSSYFGMCNFAILIYLLNYH